MKTLNVKEIQDAAIEIIQSHPKGIRVGDVVEAVMQLSPASNRGTVQTATSLLPKQRSDKVVRVERGVLRPSAGAASTKPNGKPPHPENAPGSLREESIYEPFAAWLRDVVEEVSEASSLGGSSMKAKWGTPDVVGVYRPHTGDLVKFTPEIVAAEIKVDTSQPVVAFGQAVAYRLFATKSYVVVPEETAEEDAARLESLCLLFGIGLVLFQLRGGAPEFKIRVRAQRFAPDMYYVNDFAARLLSLDDRLFKRLFS